MELQRRRKERYKKSKARDCDFVIEETKRYSGEIYGKTFEDEVCIEHPYHNHVLKIRNKDELSSDLEEALALEEIQRDYDDIADIGDGYGIDNTIDSGFLSVKDTDELDDAAVEEVGDFVVHATIDAEIELLNDTILNEKKNETEKPIHAISCDTKSEDDKEVNIYRKQVSQEKPKTEEKNVKDFSNVVANNTENTKEDILVCVENEASDGWKNKTNNIANTSQISKASKRELTEETTNKKHPVENDRDSDITKVSVENEAGDGWDSEHIRSIISAAAEKENFEEVFEKKRPSVVRSVSKEVNVSVKKERKSNWDSERKWYRYSSQLSSPSRIESIESTPKRRESVASAAGSAVSKTDSVRTTDSMQARPKIRRSRSASFSQSVRSLKRSFSSFAASLRSLTGSLWSLSRKDKDESLSRKTRTRSQSVKSLPAATKSDKREFRRLRRGYSLDSTASSVYYDPRKSNLENEVAAFERRKRVMQGYCRQADYMEKCFDMKDRKDEPYRGSMRQYRDCLRHCTKIDLEIQRQKPLLEEEKYKHLPYIDQD